MTSSSQPASFSQAEYARLSVFKAAVAAGLYTDAVSPEAARYRFSAVELERLLIYRMAVAAGFYTDELDARSAARVGA
jgi:hypothetical protein